MFILFSPVLPKRQLILLELRNSFGVIYDGTLPSFSRPRLLPPLLAGVVRFLAAMALAPPLLIRIVHACGRELPSARAAAHLSIHI